MEGIVVALQKDLKERSTPIPERLPRLGPNESLVWLVSFFVVVLHFFFFFCSCALFLPSKKIEEI